MGTTRWKDRSKESAICNQLLCPCLDEHFQARKMAKGFGELAKVRGIVQFRLSPHEQRAFAGAISQGVPNVFRRIRSEIFFVATPLLLCYLVYDQTEKKHTELLRKNPADFEHEK